MKRSVQSLYHSKSLVFSAVLAVVAACPVGSAHADMPKNGLAPELLSANAGLPDMPKNGLPAEALSADPGAQLMKYIVSCALDPSDQVTVETGDDHSGAAITWQGEIGLCKQASFGNWAFGAPSKACLDMVYACLLARTNPLRLSVPVSLRGPNNALVPRSEIPLETQYRENGGTPIASFDECTDASAAAGEGAARNCGWSRRYAGRCIANQDVTLALGSGTENAARMKGEPDMMVRVCDGIYGCDDPEGATRTPGGQRRYSRMHKTVKLGPQGTVTFACPDNGPAIRDGSSRRPARYGYFGIMLAALNPSRAIHAGMDVKPMTEGAIYPASEYQVFTVREGAFYGSFPGAPGSRPNDQYVCYGEGWDSHMAEVTGRHCASEGSSCFANAPRPCLTKGEQRSEPGACRGETAPELGGYYLACGATTEPSRFRYPITVYVNYSSR